MNKFLKVGGVATLLLAPALVLADTLIDVTNTIGDLIDLATPIVVALALVFFFYSLFKYFFSDEKEKGKSIQGMIYGVLILFVMVSIWGIVNVLQDTFNVGGTQTIPVPEVPRN